MLQHVQLIKRHWQALLSQYFVFLTAPNVIANGGLNIIRLLSINAVDMCVPNA